MQETAISTGNNELMVVNNTTGSNYEVDIYKEGVARYATYFETSGSVITYPDNTLNFEVPTIMSEYLLRLCNFLQFE